MAAFDFTATFDAIGRIFTRGLKRRIENQVGIDGGGYSFPKPSTLKSRQAKKTGTKFFKGVRTKKVKDFDETHEVTKSVFSRGLAVNIKRLYISGDLSKNAFNYIPDSSGVTVFVPRTLHKSGSGMYSDIIKGNSRGMPGVNKNIANPPLVFPATADDVKLMKPEMEESLKKLALDVTRQLKDKGMVRSKVVLNIG